MIGIDNDYAGGIVVPRVAETMGELEQYIDRFKNKEITLKDIANIFIPKLWLIAVVALVFAPLFVNVPPFIVTSPSVLTLKFPFAETVPLILSLLASIVTASLVRLIFEIISSFPTFSPTCNFISSCSTCICENFSLTKGNYCVIIYQIQTFIDFCLFLMNT